MSESKTKKKTQEELSQKDREYFRGWYENNADELNSTRKLKYSSDPSYRAKVLEQNRIARLRRKEAKLASRRLLHPDPAKTRVVRSWKTKQATITASGKPLTAKMFTVGAVADLLGCSVQAIRLWERRKVIPETPFRGENKKTIKGDRFYTLDMVDTLREILLAKGYLDSGRPKPRPMLMVTRSVTLSTGEVVDLDLYRIGELAEAVRRTVVSLEQLESRGFLPETPFRLSEAGYRLYTRDMIASVKQAFESRGWEIRGQEWAVFATEIEESWKAQGVIGAQMGGSHG
jgi:DNA-binding transcriptional MerR regulator